MLTPERILVLNGYFWKILVLIKIKSANLAALQQPRNGGRYFWSIPAEICQGNGLGGRLYGGMLKNALKMGFFEKKRIISVFMGRKAGITKRSSFFQHREQVPADCRNRHAGWQDKRTGPCLSDHPPHLFCCRTETFLLLLMVGIEYAR